jgi:hypothetical protein
MRRLLVLGVALAIVAALSSVYRVSLSPPGLNSKKLNLGAASTAFFLDTQQSGLTNSTTDPSILIFRAQVYARLIGSDPIRTLIAKMMGPGVQADDIEVTAKANQPQTASAVEPAAAQRAAGLISTTLSITTEAELGLPIVDIAAIAPTAAQAARLADATVNALKQFLSTVPPNSGSATRIVVTQIGRAVGGQVTSNSRTATAMIVFLGTFLLWCVLILFGSRVRAEWRRLEAEEPAESASVPAVDGRYGEPSEPDTASV